MPYSVKSSSDRWPEDSLAGRGGTRFSGSYRKAPQWEPADMTPFLGQATWSRSSVRPLAQ